MVSKASIRALEEAGYEYIVGTRMRRAKEAADVLRRGGRYQKVSSNLEVKSVVVVDDDTLDERRYVVCYNPEEAARDAKVRDELLAKLKEKLKEDERRRRAGGSTAAIPDRRRVSLKQRKRPGFKALATALLLLAALAGWAAWETATLSVEYVEVPIEGLPPEFDGFRIAQVSDLHGRRIDPAGREVKAVAEAGVGLIAATGDYVHGDRSAIERVLPFMESLAGIAPVYAVSGNHEHWTDWPYIAGRLRETGVTVLENSHVRIRRGEGEIILAGVSDPYTGHGCLTEALPAQADTVIVLLAHAPTWFEPWNAAAAPAGLDSVSLTLTGHTHGGQIKLPILGAVTTASGRLFPPSHVEGLLREGNGWLYINRGLGQGSFAVRFLSRREVTIITLRQGG